MSVASAVVAQPSPPPSLAPCMLTVQQSPGASPLPRHSPRTSIGVVPPLKTQAIVGVFARSASILRTSSVQRSQTTGVLQPRQASAIVERVPRCASPCQWPRTTSPTPTTSYIAPASVPGPSLVAAVPASCGSCGTTTPIHALNAVSASGPAAEGPAAAVANAKIVPAAAVQVVAHVRPAQPPASAAPPPRAQGLSVVSQSLSTPQAPGSGCGTPCSLTRPRQQHSVEPPLDRDRGSARKPIRMHTIAVSNPGSAAVGPGSLSMSPGTLGSIAIPTSGSIAAGSLGIPLNISPISSPSLRAPSARTLTGAAPVWSLTRARSPDEGSFIAGASLQLPTKTCAGTPVKCAYLRPSSPPRDARDVSATRRHTHAAFNVWLPRPAGQDHQGPAPPAASSGGCTVVTVAPAESSFVLSSSTPCAAGGERPLPGASRERDALSRIVLHGAGDGQPGEPQRQQEQQQHQQLRQLRQMLQLQIQQETGDADYKGIFAETGSTSIQGVWPEPGLVSIRGDTAPMRRTLEEIRQLREDVGMQPHGMERTRIWGGADSPERQPLPQPGHGRSLGGSAQVGTADVATGRHEPTARDGGAACWSERTPPSGAEAESLAGGSDVLPRSGFVLRSSTYDMSRRASKEHAPRASVACIPAETTPNRLSHRGRRRRQTSVDRSKDASPEAFGGDNSMSMSSTAPPPTRETPVRQIQVSVRPPGTRGTAGAEESPLRRRPTSTWGPITRASSVSSQSPPAPQERYRPPSTRSTRRTPSKRATTPSTQCASPPLVNREACVSPGTLRPKFITNVTSGRLSQKSARVRGAWYDTANGEPQRGELRTPDSPRAFDSSASCWVDGDDEGTTTATASSSRAQELESPILAGTPDGAICACRAEIGFALLREQERLLRRSLRDELDHETIYQGRLSKRLPTAHVVRGNCEFDGCEASRSTVESLFYDSLPRCKVDVEKVEYVINPALMKQFLHRVDGEETGIEVTFHGTRRKHTEKILEEGLLAESCHTGAYGLGAYVGCHAGVAHMYADPDPDGRRYMCVVLACVGRNLEKGRQGVKASRTATDCLVNPTQYCFVDNDRLLVTHLVTYNAKEIRRCRIGGGFSDPFSIALTSAIRRAGVVRRSSPPR